jgi:hypothetical protein
MSAATRYDTTLAEWLSPANILLLAVAPVGLALSWMRYKPNEISGNTTAAKDPGGCYVAWVLAA